MFELDLEGLFLKLGGFVLGCLANALAEETSGGFGLSLLQVLVV